MSPGARSTLTRQFGEGIEFYNPYFAKISTKKAISDKLGFRIDNPIWTGFFFLKFLSEQLVFERTNMTEILKILGSSATHW